MNRGRTRCAAWVRCGGPLALAVTLAACNGRILLTEGKVTADAAPDIVGSGSGGNIGTGGNIVTGSGGIVGTGGPGSGGSPGTGGIVGSGGATGTGGAVGSGGSAGTGGTAGRGGSVGTGGSAGRGGAGGTATVTGGAGSCTLATDLCGLPTLHCDVASKTCVACVTDAHCTGSGQPTWKHCNTTLHQCVECAAATSAADCATGRTCQNGRCVTTCVGTSDTDPACVGVTPYCEKDFKFCITCETGEGACTAPAFCDVATASTTLGLCVACSSSATTCSRPRR